MENTPGAKTEQAFYHPGWYFYHECVTGRNDRREDILR
jgi:hypothetical protein